MVTASGELHVLAVSGAALGTIAAFVGGLALVGALLWAFWLGNRVRGREPRPPRPEEQPKLPDSGPVHEIREMREPDEVPHAKDESERLRPENLHASGTKRSENQKRRRWSPGSSGSFGGGGPGKT
ncbi:DUF6479 family protein [Streptomyces sp. NPDC051218]|uniref:DUF6479 family protein n=1 Tax=Streptomyces sp. NPDC051218 TaxID=3365645 RepID=UPI0037A1FCD2